MPHLTSPSLHIHFLNLDSKTFPSLFLASLFTCTFTTNLLVLECCRTDYHPHLYHYKWNSMLFVSYAIYSPGLRYYFYENDSIHIYSPDMSPNSRIAYSTLYSTNLFKSLINMSNLIYSKLNFCLSLKPASSSPPYLSWLQCQPSNSRGQKL